MRPSLPRSNDRRIALVSKSAHPDVLYRGMYRHGRMPDRGTWLHVDGVAKYATDAALRDAERGDVELVAEYVHRELDTDAMCVERLVQPRSQHFPVPVGRV